MSWTTSDIDYWNPSSMWGTGLFAFTTGQASQVDADLTSYYLNSGTFKTILDSLSGLSDIKIGLTAGGSFTNLTNRYIGYNPS
ncbi:MAG TPA: hypothetical protein VJR87_01185, partial [Allosphingosinicella sp.]|nr:hypothetical protein [Allosphingosinicella sp.]